MQFNSLSYLFVFLPAVVAAWALLRRTPFANLVILAASIVFYASDKVWYLAPLFATALLDYFVARGVYASQDERRRLVLTTMSIVANLALLAWFKYAMWLTASLAAVGARYGFVVPVIHAVLPPAISFYTFQSMSYTIDIYRREFKPYNSVVDYLSSSPSSRTSWPARSCGRATCCRNWRATGTSPGSRRWRRASS
jgi:alginate O-acetyltransferase complex protein AlgI